MKKILSILTGLSLALLSTFLPLSSYAQTTRGPDPLVISVSPEAPAPGESTTITLSSTPIDLSRATISWRVNGASKESAAGLRSFTFTMGTSRGATVVSVTILAAGGEVITRTFTFHPGSVTLLWEANTYTAPFYRGKSLYSPGADVRIVALPLIQESNGAAIAASALTYKWSVDDEPFADRSGLGRNTFLLSGSQLQPEQTVSVDVIRSNGIRAAHAEMSLPSTNPMVRFYRNDPLRGTLYNQAYMSRLKLSDAETTILAEPYFISGLVREPERMVYTWSINDGEVQPQGKQRSLITLRQTAGQTGLANLELRIQNSDLRRLLQQASATIQILFGN